MALSAVACPRCAFPRRAATAPAAARPPRTAMWLSLLWPGAGHLYAGRTEKGYALCGVTAVLVGLSLTVVGPLLSLVAVLALALYAALDCNGALG